VQAQKRLPEERLGWHEVETNATAEDQYGTHHKTPSKRLSKVNHAKARDKGHLGRFSK